MQNDLGRQVEGGDGDAQHRQWTSAYVPGLLILLGTLTLFGCPSDNNRRDTVSTDLQKRSFLFSNGVVFDDNLDRQNVTLMFGDFNGTMTAPMRLTADNGTAIGRVTVGALGACDFIVTSTTFTADTGPQVNETLAADCSIDGKNNTLRVKSNSASSTSGEPNTVTSTLTGVVYVESNQVNNANAVLAFRRNTNGALTPLPGSPFLTGGSGVTIQEVPTQSRFEALGPFEADQNILVNPERTFLFTVNGGSDTVAVFHILPDGGLVPATGSPFPSGGINPASVGLAGNHLYVVNKNDDPLRPDVVAESFPSYVGFTVAADGVLTRIANSSDTDLGTVPLQSPQSLAHPPSQALVSPDHRFLFDANFFTHTLGSAGIDGQPGLLQSFRINDDGTLVQNTPIAPPAAEYGRGGPLEAVEGSPFASGGVTPVSIGLVGNPPTRLYVANSNSDPSRPDVTADNVPNYTGFTVADDGSLTPIQDSMVNLMVDLEVSTQNPTQALISPNHQFLFGVDLFGTETAFGPSLLESFQIRPNGTLVRNPPLGLPDEATGIDLNGDGTPETWALGLQVHPTQKVLYAGFVTASQLGVYTYDDHGELTFMGAVSNSGHGPCWIVVNKAGTRLYTTNTQDDTISVYDIHGDDGALNPVEISRVNLKGAGRVLQAALDDSEQFFYAISQRVFPDDPADGTSNKLTVLRVNADGTLTEVESSPTILNVPTTPFTRPQGVAVIDDVVYVESNIPTGNTILAFRRDARGALTPLGEFPTGGNGIASEPNDLPEFGPFDTDQNLVHSPDGKWLFAVNGGSDQIAVFNVQSLGIDLNGDGLPEVLPLGLQVHPTKRLLYVGFVTGQKLGVYEYDATTGELTFVQAVLTNGTFPGWIVVNKAGTRLYTSNSGNNTLSVYDITNPRTPVEMQTLSLKGNGSPFQIALDAHEEFFYAVKQRAFAGTPPNDTPAGEGNLLSILQVNADGTLTEVDSSPLDLGVDDPAPPVIRSQGVVAL